MREASRLEVCEMVGQACVSTGSRLLSSSKSSSAGTLERRFPSSRKGGGGDSSPRRSTCSHLPCHGKAASGLLAVYSLSG